MSPPPRAREFAQPIDTPWHAPVPLVVAEIAAHSPDAPAVTADGRSWTYRTLAEHAAGVAADLLDDGLGGGDVVAVTGQRTPELVACMLGVLASGCVLFPVDPALPQRRRRLLLTEAGARRVLASAGTRTARNLSQLAARTDPGDPAYLVFTSGTTGVPRGVLGRHGGLSHFLAWQRTRFPLGPGDRCGQLTGLSFDVVLRDVFLPLTAGATLCLPPGGEPPAPPETLAWLRDERITVLHAVPTVMRSWLADCPVPSLRRVFFAGEPLTGELVNDVRAAVSPTAEVVNLYGPTETTLAKTFYRVPVPAPAGPQPVGHPLPQTQIFVVTGDGRLCDDGEPGEITIRTPFRTTGYLDGTGFVPNPVHTDDGDLVFRTGDRGVRSADGTLSVLGRLDDQIKIRGVRIEPAEVGAVLAGHPAVRDAVVLGHPGADGTPRLAGFAVLKQPAAATGVDLRADLQLCLPAVMVPDRITVVPAFPTTPNGKLDRAALLALDGPAAASPDTATHLGAMAEIWSDVLGLQVNADDDFFAIGGHSLHAATILSRVRKSLGLTVPMRAFFEWPTLADFTRAAAQLGVADDEPELSALDRSVRNDERTDERTDVG